MRQPYLEIGKIVGTHGVRGEVRVQPWCDTPEFMKQFKTLFLQKNGEKEVRVLACRPHGNVVILKLQGIDTVEQAAALRERVLFMRRADAHLDESQVFIQDLLGCAVLDADDETIVYGVLSDVSKTGANDVWHIKDKTGKEYLIPAIPDVVISMDLDAEQIRIRPLKGIFDDAN